MSSQLWNSLEIAKLLSSILTPIALSVFGIYIHRISKRFESMQWRSQKLIEKRLSVYDDLSPSLNDLLCYFTYIGCWKELSPLDVIKTKRIIDKKIHLAAPLFSKKFYSCCIEFQDLCFETYSEWGKDALLKTNFQRRKDAYPQDWITDWDELFSEKASAPQDIRKAYNKIMECFAIDIGVHPEHQIPEPSVTPINIC